VLKESVLSEGQVYLHKSLIIEFVYLVPISVMNVFIAPYFRLISSFLSYFSNNNVFLFLLAIKLFLYVLHVFNIAYCRQWKLSLCFILYIVVLHDYQNKILFIFFKKWAAETDFRGMADCERLSGHSAKRSSRIYMPYPNILAFIVYEISAFIRTDGSTRLVILIKNIYS